ncbi:hypothetical protein FRB95_003079 [Tulasnella sp. JGI-2019a]|nr:hypothetical protein FRB95_003079 [Tulasnella sp. JGI-2019a]
MASMLQRHAHPILFVDEIIIEFLQHVHQPQSGIDNTDINAAGLTCKAWRDPSLAVKWNEVYLIRLLSFLAPLRKSDVEGRPAVWVFARVPTESDHHRFHDIARRVHFLKDGGHLQLGKSVFATISSSIPESTVLLSNLRSAHFIARRFGPIFVTTVARLLPFYPLSLRQLALSIDPSSAESRETLLRNLASRFSKLSTVSFYRGALTHADVGAMAELLEHNSDLRHVMIQQSVTSTQVDALLKLPRLELLEIGAGRLNEPLDYRRCPREGPFPQLRSLTIQLTLDARVFNLLTNIGAHHSLQTLKIVSPHKGLEPLDLDAAVDAVVKHPLLRQLSLCHFLVPTSQISVLQTIAACTMLELLEVDILTTSGTLAKSSADTPIADGVVGNLLQHLPRLTELMLSVVDHQSSEPLFTFRALVVAVAHCPLLKRVTLVIDTRIPVAIAPATHQNERPRVLDFSFTVSGLDDSPIDDPEYVADVIAQLRPEVDIRMNMPLHGWYRWGDVAYILSRAHDVSDKGMESEFGLASTSLAVLVRRRAYITKL